MLEQSCGKRLVLIAAGACLLAGPGQAGGEDVGFDADIVPIFNAHCVACHMPGQAQGEIALHPKVAHRNLVGVASVQSALLRVDPGAPERSYLIHKLRNTHLGAGGEGEPMPMGTQLPPDQVDVIARWIEQGAAAD